MNNHDVFNIYIIALTDDAIIPSACTLNEWRQREVPFETLTEGEQMKVWEVLLRL